MHQAGGATHPTRHALSRMLHPTTGAGQPGSKQSQGPATSPSRAPFIPHLLLSSTSLVSTTGFHSGGRGTSTRCRPSTVLASQRGEVRDGAKDGEWLLRAMDGRIKQGTGHARARATGCPQASAAAAGEARGQKRQGIS